MTEKKFITWPIQFPAMAKPMLVGATIALILICLFLSGTEAKPEWGTYWKVRPLAIVTFAGAIGGAFYYLIGGLRQQGGWKMILANVISLVVFVFGLWIGTVLGLVGTLWD